MNKFLGSFGALSIGVAAAAALLPIAAVAQEAPASDEIVVTGSRLTTSVNAAQPIVTITSADLAARGETRLADALAKIPSLLTTLSSEQSLRDGAVTGRSSLSLRGLGAQRTLVLVNGRRHVAGDPGTSAVDVSTIPSGLVERVDVLTGGASAVYGSDAVTGVVNFILKDDFEGVQLDLQGGSSFEGDSDQLFASALFGKNFSGGKGNVTFSVQMESQSGIRYGDRDFSKNNGLATDQANPALRFQKGDPIPAGRTEANTIGNRILSGGVARYAGTDPALVARALAAKPFTFVRDNRFSISSTSGLIGFSPRASDGDFASRSRLTNWDVDNNGIFDCDESTSGTGTAPTFVAGCWIVDPQSGAVRPFNSGTNTGGINSFGGDGAEQGTDGDSLTPDTRSIVAQLSSKYEFDKKLTVYGEFKAVRNEAKEFNFYNTFDDTIIVGLDNPYIPQALRTIAEAEIAARLLANPAYDPADFNLTIARDHIDVFDPITRNTRESLRGVVGARGDLNDVWSYDLSYNTGRTEQKARSPERLRDRFFAAVDVTTDSNGNPVCRITNDGTIPIASGLDGVDFSFTPAPPVSYDPADCVPLNLFGRNKNSAEALAFQRYYGVSKAVIKQEVVSGVLIGDSSEFFALQGGPIGIAVGAEYRQENSESLPDIIDRTGNAFEGRDIAAVKGGYWVKEAFAEVSAPLLSGLPFADTLTLTSAGRVSEYSTVGSTTAYKFDAIYAPVRDVRFRGGMSQTVRAPGILELFRPGESVNSNPTDPCLQDNIGLGTNPANRLANCNADFGRDLSVTPHVNEPTAQFPGRRIGNPELREETSETSTIGVVVQPRYIPGLRISVDYWSVRIENAIQAISQNNIVANCYDAPSLDNQFCGLFTRDPVTGIFTSITQKDVNFSALTAAGTDFEVSYSLDLSDLGLGSLARSVDLGVVGTYMDELNDFPFVSSPSLADPELGELSRPEVALQTSVVFNWEKLKVGFFSNYQSQQTLRAVEVEERGDYAPNSAEAFWSHDLSLTYSPTKDMSIIFGIDNVTDENPFIAETSYPVSAVGRTGFVRLSLKQ